MFGSTLYTYRDIKELRKIQNEREVHTFTFVKTKDMIDSCPDVCIDISALVYFLQSNTSNIQPVYINFEGLTDKTLIIANELIAESAQNLLPFLITSVKNYFPQENVDKQEEIVEFKSFFRKKIYKYNNVNDLNCIVQYSKEHNIPLATFSRASGELKKEFEQFNKSTELALIDLTSISFAIEDNKNLIYILEQFLSGFPNVRVIAQTAQVDVLLKYFPLFFDGQESIREILPGLREVGEEQTEQSSILRIIDFKTDDLDRFMEIFSRNLIGHNYFKERFKYSLKNFIALNKAKEQKVFSVFLFGPSGIGKTEVARLIANGLQENSYLAKINFQNYSSQDALNSLIGSPAGYVGCNHGELSEKIQKSKVGLLLCDEFEKTTRPVFSFFLELLEEGRFTDSMAREYDLDGYIIIFTSNISNESEYKKIIPPELQTRFDLVCEFEQPSSIEKIQFLDLLLEKAYKKYPEQFAVAKMTDEDKSELYNFDFSGIIALRDIKRIFNNRLMDFFARKGVQF